MDIALAVTQYKSWLAEHYKEGSAFTVKGTGKQQYMCSIDVEQAIYLLEQALKLQNKQETKEVLRKILKVVAN